MVGAQGSIDYGIKAAELNEDALADYNRQMLESGVNDKAGRRAAIRAIYSNTGTWDMDEVDSMLDTYGYRTGGRVGYEYGGKSGRRDEGFSGIHRARRIWSILPDDIQGQYPGGFDSFHESGDWYGVDMKKGGKVKTTKMKMKVLIWKDLKKDLVMHKKV